MRVPRDSLWLRVFLPCRGLVDPAKTVKPLELVCREVCGLGRTGLERLASSACICRCPLQIQSINDIYAAADGRTRISPWQGLGTAERQAAARCEFMYRFVVVCFSEHGDYGFAIIDPAMVDALYVRPEAQGRGVGSALLDVAKTISPHRLRLWCSDVEDRAKAFYVKNGFEPTDRVENELGIPLRLFIWKRRRRGFDPKERAPSP
jgi:putative acetyltransferase